MWELDHKEGWAPKNWCFRIVVVEKTLESPLDCRDIKPVNPKGNQSWRFIGRTDAEAPILWPPDVKSQFFGEKTLILGKIEGKRRRGWQRMRWLDSITNSVDMNLSKLRKIVESRGTWHATVHGVTKSRTQLSNWTTARSLDSHLEKRHRRAGSFSPIMWRCSEKDLHKPGRGFPPGTESAVSSFSLKNFQPLQLWAINFYCLGHQSVVFFMAV